MKKWINRSSGMTLEEIVRKNLGIENLSILNEWESESLPIIGFEKAKVLILNHVRRGLPITVVGDYDVDGVMATFIMRHMLKKLGADVRVRIPHRFSEGYGLNESIIDEISEGLLITVDNGISAYEAVEKARNKGLSVIITDHHLPTGKIPNANVVIDPNALTCCRFTGYCGAGIAYKLASYVLDDEDAKRIYKISAAIATIADVVPLKEENRGIVKAGLKDAVEYSYLLPKGFYSLLNKLYFLDHIDEGDVGYKLAPCINASGRLYDDGGEIVLSAISGNYEDAIDQIIEANEKRKSLTSGLVEKAEEVIRENGMENDYPLLICIPNAPLGIVGLAAASIAEKYQRPAFVLGDAGNGIFKGSGRSYGSKDLKALLDASAKLLAGYGGHASAAGLSVAEENIEALRASLKSNYGEIEKLDENVYFDYVAREDSFKSILDELEIYAPFGEGNPDPIFYIPNFVIQPDMGMNYRIMGKEKNVIKFKGVNSDAIGFSETIQKYMDLGYPKAISIVGKLKYNYFKGNKRPQIEIIDICPAGKEVI